MNIRKVIIIRTRFARYLVRGFGVMLVCGVFVEKAPSLFGVEISVPASMLSDMWACAYVMLISGVVIARVRSRCPHCNRYLHPTFNYCPGCRLNLNLPVKTVDQERSNNRGVQGSFDYSAPESSAIGAFSPASVSGVEEYEAEATISKLVATERSYTRQNRFLRRVRKQSKLEDWICGAGFIRMADYVVESRFRGVLEDCLPYLVALAVIPLVFRGRTCSACGLPGEMGTSNFCADCGASFEKA